MSISFSLRLHGAGRQQGGNNSPQTPSDREKQRRQKLQALLDNLKAGNLDAARTAFIALVNFDPSMSSDPNLDKIGAALQSSNLYAAQHFGLELQSRGVQLQTIPSTQSMTSMIKAPQLWDEHHGTARIDLSA
jgi:hypothetical protein